MYKITNIDQLGTAYTVADEKGTVIKTIQIVPQAEILETALGEYNESFGSVSNYLESSIATMTGFEQVDPTKVLWYATIDDEVVLADLIEYAVRNGYDKIILEHLEDLDQ